MQHPPTVYSGKFMKLLHSNIEKCVPHINYYSFAIFYMTNKEGLSTLKL